MTDKREMTFDELSVELEKTKKIIGEIEVSKHFYVERADDIMRKMAMMKAREVVDDSVGEVAE